MAPSNESIHSSTTILDLNDDCLREVFEHLDLMDLCAVADVCSRFRYNAYTHFASSKYKRFSLRNFDDEVRTCTASEELVPRMVKISNVMHRFGTAIEEIDVENVFERISKKYQNEIVDLLTSCCGDKLTTLHLRNLNITDEMARKLQPLLRSLRTLSLNSCEWKDDVLLKMLPTWSPKLRELKLRQVTVKRPPFDGLCQKFPKLEKFALVGVDIEKDVISDFLECNSQIKEANFDFCYGSSDSILEVIAKNLRQIEKLSFIINGMELKLNGPTNTKCLGQLMCLKSLTIGVIDHHFSMENIQICEIDFTNIPLEYLELCYLELCGKFDQVVAGISKLKNLKRLELCRLYGTSESHIVAISKYHTQLTELHLIENDGLALSLQNLLDILKNAAKLEQLTYVYDKWSGITENGLAQEMVWINVDAYKEFVRVVQNRGHKISLSIDSPLYRMREVPNELIQLHKDCFKLTLEDYSEEEDQEVEDDRDDCE